MDDMEILVAETYRHLNESKSEGISLRPQEDPYLELPQGPGLIYHLQKSPSVFVIRTLVSKNIHEDFKSIAADPSMYPSLRISTEDSGDISKALKYFAVENSCEAEIVHDQLNNRRFPVSEETLCNLSDPGFSWWLTKNESDFQLSFTLSVHLDAKTVKLGPLGDHQLAMRNFQFLSTLFQESGLGYTIQNEGHRILFGEEDTLLQEEFQNIFEFGEISDNLTNVFKILARRFANNPQVETCWLYLHEVAAVRRFWIQIQYDLSN